MSYKGDTLTLANGQIVKHGFGKMIYNTGAVYEGEWKMNVMHGHGVYDWKDGNLFIGSFENGKQNGLGTYRWPTGGVYTGQWKDDSMNGFGRYTRSDGVVYEGWWKNDSQCGEGRKIIQERICFGDDRVSTVQRVFAEEWDEGHRLVHQKEVQIHPGALMHHVQSIDALTDCDVVCDETDPMLDDCADFTFVHASRTAWVNADVMRKTLCCPIRTFRSSPSNSFLSRTTGFTAQLSPLSTHDIMMDISSPRSSRSAPGSISYFESIEMEDVKE